MTEHDNEFHGYIRAQFEQLNARQDRLSSAANEIREEVSVVRAGVAVLEQTTAKATDVAALKATARAWGIFAGSVSGILTAIGAKLWRP